LVNIRRKRDNNYWIQMEEEIWIIESYVQTSKGACRGEEQIPTIGSERE
jgi:hypothetical protein